MPKKIIYYYQTFNGLKKILFQETPVTHIHLSSIHFGLNTDNSPYIHLNDFAPSNTKFDNVWKELEEAEKYNITTILMVGGAGGAFNNLFNNFDTYYPLLKDLVLNKKVIKGIDLDIEEYVKLEDVKMLIRQIKNDFGQDFLITMAPIQSSLQEDNPGMGGFIYKELYSSEEGKMIEYFNGQFYFNYSEESYTEAINNGYPSEKVIMGMISGQDYTNELKKVILKYGDEFGGVFIWEYYDAPPTWYLDIQKIFNNTSQVCCIN